MATFKSGRPAQRGRNERDDADVSRSKVSQSDFPQLPLARALRIAQALWDNFAGRGGAPYDVAVAIDMSPTSGSWRNLCGTSIAYGLTEGGYNAAEITLTELGRRIVAPTDEGDDALARREAVMRPRIMREFFNKYNRAKFPSDVIAQNVLVSLGLPKDRAANALEVLRENGTATGIIRETKTGPFVAVDSVPTPPGRAVDVGGTARAEPAGAEDEPTGPPEDDTVRKPSPPATPTIGTNNRVFITHGKNRSIVDQLKELLTFGKFEPVVSVEKDTKSIPVPEKVLQDMRSCAAAVIHVSNEGELLDSDGNKHVKINDNVLIEIGAAMALYDKNFVLLVQEGVALPSNLQGLYRCEYEGDKLDYAATMKLLKTFNQFR
jgi:hypothetical protein